MCTVFQYTVVDTLAIALKLLLQLECTFMSIAIIRKWQKFKYRKSSNKHPRRLFQIQEKTGDTYSRGALIRRSALI